MTLFRRKKAILIHTLISPQIGLKEVILAS